MSRYDDGRTYDERAYPQQPYDRRGYPGGLEDRRRDVDDVVELLPEPAAGRHAICPAKYFAGHNR